MKRWGKNILVVLSEISEMKRWWRGEEWDEEMNRWQKFFWVRTCIKSNLVLSEISEMKRWRVRWRDEKNFFWVQTCIKPNLVLSEISEMKRWRVRWRDEMKKKIFGSEHVSSQICCQKFFPLPKKLHPTPHTHTHTDRQTYGHYSD